MLLTTYTEKAEKMQGIEAILQDIPEEKMQEDFETTISNTEVDTVEAEIIDLQLNLFQSGTEYFDALTQEFEQLTNYEETGDFNLEVNIDEENI
ncbi:MAG: hypothetical protein H6767_06045 [Candidatus Peribacteria bacterium]|nr:MAG: hypothetical protein H6767_06045 [Candidatus Peribacteria bacterium]